MLDESTRLYFEARAAIEADNLSLALEKLQRSATLLPHYKTYELLGECHLRRNELIEAVLYLSAATGLGNKQFRCRYLLAQALIKLDPSHETDALGKLEEALALNPHYKAARQLLEEIMRRSNKDLESQ